MSSQTIIPDKSLTSNNDSNYIVSASSTRNPYVYRGFNPFTTGNYTNSWISSGGKYTRDITLKFNYAKSAWSTSSTVNINSTNVWPNATSAYINGNVTENYIQALPNPYGRTKNVWVCKNMDTNTGGGSIEPDGGWNVTFNNISDSKNYISIVYVKRVGTGSSGSFYHGCSYSTTMPLVGSTPETNPYFTNSGGGVGLWKLPQDEWCVCISFIYSKNSTVTTNNTNGGIYVLTGPDAGKKLDTGVHRSFKMKNGATEQTHRAYLFYSETVDTYSSTNSSILSQTASTLLFWEPGFYEWDPSEEFSLPLLTIPSEDAEFRNKYSGTSKINSRLGEYLTIEFPKKISLSSINIQNTNNDKYRGDPFTVYIFGSNDNTTWTEIGYKTNLQHGKLITNTIPIYSGSTNNLYNSYALLFTNIIGYSASYVSINKITFTGVIEGSSSQVTLPDKDIQSLILPFDYSDPNVSYVANVVGGVLPGMYIIKETSFFPDAFYEPFKAFDNNDDSLWGSNGFYNNTTSTRPKINGIEGEYLILECPIRYKLSGYRIKNSGWTDNIPETIYLFGSNDNSTWTQLDTRSGLVGTSKAMNPPQSSTGSWFNINPQNSYKSYAILVSKLNKNLVKQATINRIEYLGIPDVSTYIPISTQYTSSPPPSDSIGSNKSGNIEPKNITSSESDTKKSIWSMSGYSIISLIFICVGVVLLGIYTSFKNIGTGILMFVICAFFGGLFFGGHIAFGR